MKLDTEQHRDTCWTEDVTAAHVSAVQVLEGRRGEKEAREDLRGGNKERGDETRGEERSCRRTQQERSCYFRNRPACPHVSC